MSVSRFSSASMKKLAKASVVAYIEEHGLYKDDTPHIRAKDKEGESQSSMKPTASSS